MDTDLEIRMQRAYEAMELAHIGRMEFCETCGYHNEECPYYDPEEESWDYEQCIKENEWW